MLQGLYLPAPRLNELHILSQIASDPEITQAELAQRCALSVAMVNNYMKELCAAGQLEYRRKSSKSISYHLTTAGREAIAATQRELLREGVRLFADAKERVREMILSRSDGKLRRVVLYGTGDLAELVFHALELGDVKIVGICDDRPAETGRDWFGRETLNPSQILFVAPDSVVIATLERVDDIYRSLLHLEGRGIRLIRLDEVDGRRDLPQPAPEELPLTPSKRAV